MGKWRDNSREIQGLDLAYFSITDTPQRGKNESEGGVDWCFASFRQFLSAHANVFLIHWVGPSPWQPHAHSAFFCFSLFLSTNRRIGAISHRNFKFYTFQSLFCCLCRTHETPPEPSSSERNPSPTPSRFISHFSTLAYANDLNEQVATANPPISARFRLLVLFNASHLILTQIDLEGGKMSIFKIPPISIPPISIPPFSTCQNQASHFNTN